MILVNGRQLTISSFSNGERRISLPDKTLKLKNKRNVVVWEYENDGDFLLLQMVQQYIKRNDKSERQTTCVVKSMPYERMDRSENGSVCSLHSAIKILPETWDYVIIAPHSNEVLKTFEYAGLRTDTYRPMFDVMDFARSTLVDAANGIKTALVFPDKGAYGRYSADVLYNIRVPLHEVVYGNKTRNFETGDIEGLELLNQDGEKIDSLNGFNAIVIDDLSSYGGTFVKVHELLTEMNVNKSFLLLEKTEDSILKGDLIGRYTKIFTTDLMMKVVEDPTFTPELEVLSGKEILRKITQKIGGFK